MTTTVQTAAKHAGARSRVIFSGIQPTGIPHLGNYLGAMKNWKRLQDEVRADHSSQVYFSVVGLHAITLPQDPSTLRRESRDMMAALLAIGLDPNRCTLFRQEQVKQHAELAWYLNCLAPFGRLQRMTTWKSRLATARNANSEAEVDESLLHLGLFAYPVLQAADILLYGTTEVPVGEDQGQHIELTRDLATLFNKQFKQKIFTIPRQVYTPQARVLNLRDPSAKMSKSNPDPKTRILLTDSPEAARDKLRTAVTDSTPNITYDPQTRPGVSNLIGIMAGLSHISEVEVEKMYRDKSMKQLKDDLGDKVEELLVSFQTEFSKVRSEQGYLEGIERQGREKASERAEEMMQGVRTLVGLDY